jgi:hypothetical protein
MAYLVTAGGPGHRRNQQHLIGRAHIEDGHGAANHVSVDSEAVHGNAQLSMVIQQRYTLLSA